jgi:hypothetical protein
MNILALTLVAFLTVTDAAVQRGATLRADSPASRHIMEHAVRVNRQGQRIIQENDNKFELSAMYSFQFDTCVSLRAEPSDAGEIIFDANLEIYSSKGEIVSQKSYILFNVCKTKYCEYYKADDNLYMIDVGTYMSAIADYFISRHEAYCSACVDSYNYCKYVHNIHYSFCAITIPILIILSSFFNIINLSDTWNIKRV